jgi:hypothetical protein
MILPDENHTGKESPEDLSEYVSGDLWPRELGYLAISITSLGISIGGMYVRLAI